MGIIAWKDMQVGQTVRFVRFVPESTGYVHDHWDYVPGKTYTVGFDADGDFGALDGGGAAPQRPYADRFEFELVSDS